MAETRIVNVSRRYSAPPETVFDAWLDVGSVRSWLFATADGEIVRAELDASVGGSFLIIDRRAGMDVEHCGEYLEIERPRRLIFTFKVPQFSDLSTRVSLQITPLTSGCELELSHEGVLPDYADRTKEGWRGILAALGRVLGEPPADSPD